MRGLYAVPEPSIIRHTVPTNARKTTRLDPARSTRPMAAAPPPRHKTFTGAIGAVCMFPLRAIIRLCVALRIHPNTLTLIGVIINVAAAWALGYGHFILAGVIMIVANIFDFIDGKVAHEL